MDPNHARNQNLGNLWATLNAEQSWHTRKIADLVLSLETVQESAVFNRVFLTNPKVLMALASFLYQCLHVFIMGLDLLVRFAAGAI